ncbi:MAG: nucleobase:cation symporter-2 family protein [Leptolyngbyaceae cyanobacterium MO_188.B28]|nr:nucleobase:cation symporter-2 family protein [Leptolyngbyaceae cyanobacterium MO_188.B28]
MAQRDDLRVEVSMQSGELLTEEPISDSAPAPSDLIYGLADIPPLREAIFAAAQHVLACFIGIVAPSLIIGGALGLAPETTAYLVSMSLFVSGIATLIQVKRLGPIGSGLLSIQGTSFAFIGPIIATGSAAIATGTLPEQALGVIFGLCFCGSFIEILLSRFLHFASRVMTPLVTGTVVSLIGLTLIKVGVTAIGGGVAAIEVGTFGSLQNLGLAALVLVTIVVLNSSGNVFLRMASIAIGLIVGYIVALFMGVVDLSHLGAASALSIPIPFRFGFGFSPAAFIPFALLFLITTIESIGDLTATSAITGEPIQGKLYLRRIKGGVLGDGVNSLIAACFNTFPNTTFSQNNGVIQLTGVGSRYVGFFIAAFFMIAGLFPMVGGFIQAAPQPVLGGATLIMFGSVATAGIRILATITFTKRSAIILATSLGLGLGVVFAPDIVDQLPPLAKSIFSSGISTGGLCALLLNLLLPGERD